MTLDDVRSLIVLLGGISIFLASLVYAREYFRGRAQNREFWSRLDARMQARITEERPAETDLQDLKDRLTSDAARLRHDVEELEARIHVRGEGSSPAR